ncbi:MAG TPA: hypothetical protein PKL70_19330 [Saprospiraceae bacterium]|nr:hypothetical protein [Saprospiraceae bacterium]
MIFQLFLLGWLLKLDTPVDGGWWVADGPHPPGVIRHGIDKNQSLEMAQQPQYACVGRMSQGYVTKGSCVLIRPGVALTAAHTLTKLHPTLPLMAVFDSMEVKVDSFRIHPWYYEFPEADLAILYLSVPLNHIPLPGLNRKKKETGQTGTTVGFGNFSVANDPSHIIDAGKLKSAGQNMLDSVAGAPLPDKNRPQLFADFDHPEDPRFNRSGTAECLPLEYGLDGGDSGGGLFIVHRGRTLLAGINAIQNKNIADIIRTRSFYGSSSQWVRISVFRKWIRRNS